MKKILLCGVVAATLVAACGADSQAAQRLDSPSGTAWLLTDVDAEGRPLYSLGLYGADGSEVVLLEPSPLGLLTDAADFSRGLTLTSERRDTVARSYDISRTKTSHSDYRANALTLSYQTPEAQKTSETSKTSEKSAPRTVSVRFELADNSLAYRYELPQTDSRACTVVTGEATGFAFPEGTTTFMSPQSDPMIGWHRTKPSYEEEYTHDAPLDAPSSYGHGFTFPALFHVGDRGWALVSETGTAGQYPGCRLSDYDAQTGLFTVAFPMEGENNGFGSTTAQMPLPSETPWRTIAFGETLKPIVETTVQFDVVEPLYEPSTVYAPGRSSWSWILWGDGSMNYDDQITFAKLVKDMGWEYLLLDALWDTQVGRERMPQLIKEIQDMGVEVFLWYNSNGGWNDAPQGAKQCMADPIARKKEMKWLQELGVKGLKVDFFGGDKQETLKLYEAILSDANDFGLQIIFHGCTLPRGWERMYPNYCSSEAVLASENMVFNQHFCDEEARNLTLHPFCRNAVGSMDFGGTFLQRHLNKKNNEKGSLRRTTDPFELAAAVVVQSPVQNFSLSPRDLLDQPAWEIDFMRRVPTAWDETRFIDGYPGRYVVLARRSGQRWYLAALNALAEPLTIDLDAAMLAEMFPSATATLVSDGKDLATPTSVPVRLHGKKPLSLRLAPNGGAVVY